MATEKETDKTEPQGVEALAARMKPLAAFVELLAKSVAAPVFRPDGEHSSFRYESPDLRNFLLLKAVTAVGALNAAISLAPGRYWNEVCTLVRVAAEANSHIEWALMCQVGTDDERLECASYVGAYFEDAQRRSLGNKKGIPQQGMIHRVIGTKLDPISKEMGFEGPPHSELLSQGYQRLSYFVHGRYPEAMQRYNPNTRRFDIEGYEPSTLDSDCVELIDTHIDAVILSAKTIGLISNLSQKMRDDPMLAAILDFEAPPP
jgi:hypothetical protein